MKKTLIIALSLILFLTLVGCSSEENTGDLESAPQHVYQEEMEYLMQELDKRQIAMDEIDLALSEEIMEFEEVKYAYVIDHNTVVAAEIFYYPDTDEETVQDVNLKVWELLEEAYPGRTLNLGFSSN